MAINDVSLTQGMRSNLVSLQSTVTLLNRTQERLATGKKVNSALDNPTNFFSAQTLNQRASDLSGLKDGMSQAVQTIKAANAGISGIQSLIASAKALAQTALATSNVTTRASYATQYDSIRTQIYALATDSGYNGKNLLNDNNLTVNFNEDGSSSLTITGTAANAGITIDPAANAWAGDADITAAVTQLTTATTSLLNTSSSLSSNLAVINARQDFTTAVVNTLTTGVDNLTLADMNEEGANMLMLQTRQSLGTTALSLSSQAAQSVLKLF
ncbi:MAG: flagellin [Nitrospirota bacterium]